MTDVGAPPSTAVDTEGVPRALTELSRWLCWKPVRRDGEWTKEPRDAAAPERDHSVSATDAANLTTFSTAADAATDRDDRGLGFTFMADGPLVGVDLDDCRDPDTGELTERAETIVESLESYAEVSPSGTGVHVIVRGELTEDDRNRNDDVEVYDRGRYFTVTGDHLEGTPTTITDGGLALDGLLADLEDDRDDGEADRPPHTTGSDGENRPPAGRSDGFDGSDRALVAKAKDAKNGDKFARLWEFAGGSKDSPAGYDSHSEADLALCGLLAFWTGGDRGRIDDLFRQSGLYREKWDRDDYRERTIGKALEGRTEFYSPSSSERRSTVPDGGATAEAGREAGESRPQRSESTEDSPPGPQAWQAEKDATDASTNAEKAYYGWRVLRDDVDVLAARDNGELFAYHEGVWEPDGEQVLREHAGRFYGPDYSRNLFRELSEQLLVTEAVERDDLGTPAGTIAVENGLLDVADRDLRDLRPDDYALTQLPVRFDPDADCPRFRSFLDDVVPENDRAALQEYIGYCLLAGEFPIHRALMIVGEGATGKSTFLRVVRALLGTENLSHQSLQDLSEQRFAPAELYGKIANVHADLTPAGLGAGSRFKPITGGDSITAERKHQDPFTFHPTAKHVYAANRVPNVSVDDDAFYRRWLIIPFPNWIPPADRDQDLSDRLTTDDELAGVLNWALEGLDRLVEHGRFTGEGTVGDKRDLWQSYSDSVERFINEYVEFDPDAVTQKATAYTAYTAFCDDAGLPPEDQQKLTRELKKHPKVEDGRRKMNGDRPRVYLGACLTEDAPDHAGTGDGRDGNQSRLGDR